MSRIPFGRGAILCFHSVTSSRLSSASDTHVTYAGLRQITSAVRSVAEIIPLADLLSRHRSGRSTAGLVAFTFDDAYHALLDIADEYFGKGGVPATVFVTTSAARRGSAYWWDRLEEVLARADEARWAHFVAACGVPRSFLDGQAPEYGPLRPLRQWLLREHKGRWPEELEAPLRELEQQLGSRTLHRSMSFEELQRIAAIAGVDLAVHTRTHAALPFLSPTEFQEEVGGGFQELRDRFPDSRPLLAIPFGLFDRDTGSRARAAGMQAAFTLTGQTLRAEAADSPTLPRICVMRGTAGWKLLARMLGVQELLRRGQVEPFPELPSETT